ncbi:MAG: Recombinase [Parcubacteria group bacterium GW2011_GWA2_38_13]|nr:MAG: Recombinase [Parcubacteria group bacterium GW2011_GWA2_38_13]
MLWTASDQRLFELYAEGNWRLEDAANFLAHEGIKTKGGKPIKRDQVSYMLSNPFYVGLFRYAGELHEGKYQPIISKQLFDKVQAALKERSKPPKNSTNNPQALCGLIRCGLCGMMITAEHRIKRQKNGNVHEYTYYRCTHKSKTIQCSEPPVRKEELNRQLSNLLKKYALPDDWAAELLKMSERDEKEAAQSTTALAQTMRGEIQGISQKLQRLLDAYLDQDIERESYRSEKANLLSRKKSLEEKIGKLKQGANVWIEPLRDWIKNAQMLNGIDETTPLPLKKSFAQKIFGLNPSVSLGTGLTLHAREARGVAEIQWAAIVAAHQQVEKIPLCNIIVRTVGVVPLETGLKTQCVGGGIRTLMGCPIGS